MLQQGGNEIAAPLADDPIVETTTANFRKDVIAESARIPVLVDFWAPWCGPCKQLTPIIEKAVRRAKGKVRLAKLNIDEHPQIASQLGIQSIPAVIAFDKGRPIDGFMGALPESQVMGFIDRLVGPTADVGEDLLKEAESARAAGDTAQAERILQSVLSQDRENSKAAGALATLYAEKGDLARARETLKAFPETNSDQAIAAARVSLQLAEKAADIGDLANLRARCSADPNDLDARFDLAVGLNAAGERAEAAGNLLAIIKRDRNWNDDAARKQLIQFFESWGPIDPDTIAARRSLSSLLFS